jgi:hypothetical protein
LKSNRDWINEEDYWIEANINGTRVDINTTTLDGNIYYVVVYPTYIDKNGNRNTNTQEILKSFSFVYKK